MTGKQDSSFEFMDGKCHFSVLCEREITWCVINGYKQQILYVNAASQPVVKETHSLSISYFENII